MSVERRQDLICGAALLLIWVAVWIPRLNGPIDLRWDAGTYYVLGTALAEGKGYRLLNEPGEIKSCPIPAASALDRSSASAGCPRQYDYSRSGLVFDSPYFVISGSIC